MPLAQRYTESSDEVWKNSMIFIASVSIMALVMFVFRIIEGLRYTHLDILLRACLKLLGESASGCPRIW